MTFQPTSYHEHIDQTDCEYAEETAVLAVQWRKQLRHHAPSIKTKALYMLSDNPHYPHSQSTKAVMLFVALPPPKRQSLTQRHSNTRQKCKSTTLNGQKEMVTTRVELATLALLAPRSNQLTG
jgi:hypothetical protein